MNSGTLKPGDVIHMTKCVRRTTVRQGTNSVWECECLCCGMRFNRNSNHIRRTLYGCGCLKQTFIRATRRAKIIGRRYGHLEIIRAIDERRHGYLLYEAVCTFRGCGKVVKVFPSELADKVSCGCYSAWENKTRPLRQIWGLGGSE